ncbi:MAG: hypothetical protein ACM3SY_15940 [Candidatus Omnitrophota bacterium]
MRKKIYVSLIVFLFVTTWSFGYIDPGTGSYVIQVVLGVLVGASLGIKIFWTKIKTSIQSLFSKNKKEEGNQ